MNFEKCVTDMKIGDYVIINMMLNMTKRDFKIILVKNVIQYSLYIATINILEDLQNGYDEKYQKQNQYQEKQQKNSWNYWKLEEISIEIIGIKRQNGK